VALAFAVLVCAVGWSAPASAEDAPAPRAPVLDRLFPELKKEVCGPSTSTGTSPTAPTTRPWPLEYQAAKLGHVRHDYHLPWLAPTFLRGLWFRARAVIIDQEHARQLDYQFRLSVNWERNLF